MHCELCDIGFEGDKFTWRNHSKQLDHYIYERLDRSTANAKWCEMFPEFSVFNGAPRHSDHRPVIVNTQGGDRCRSKGAEHSGLRRGGYKKRGAAQKSRVHGRSGGSQGMGM